VARIRGIRRDVFPLRVRLHKEGAMSDATVFVVDDDPAMRESLSFLIGSVGIRVKTFENAHAFLDQYDSEERGCLVLDVRMPGMSGLELQERLSTTGVSLPVVMVTGYGDVPMAVRALKSGALDFIEKPFTDQELLDRVNEALNVDRRIHRETKKRLNYDARVGRLTERELQVMRLVVDGKSNKMIAHELGLSPKTVEVHRARVMDKMEVGSLAQLLRLVIGHSPQETA
jgi:FixJ family two-component response regulator